MDPNATYRNIIDSLNDADDESAREYARYLLEWIYRGGFKPDDWSESAEELRRWLKNIING